MKQPLRGAELEHRAPERLARWGGHPPGYGEAPNRPREPNQPTIHAG
jgi:hypothetical protein